MASRESFDLFTKNGRTAFFRSGIFGNEWGRSYAWIDTVGHHISAVIGHTKETYLSIDCDIGEAKEICFRCNRPVSKEAEG